MLTLASDFGTPYPAAMRGIVLQRTDCRLVDIGHDFPRQDVRATAFWLREVLPYFPPATHLVVVDPGVGTDRNALVVRAGDHVLVGPDNGVLRPPVRRLADGGPIEAYVVDEQRLDPPKAAGASREGSGDGGPASNTFHGRDVFAPAAADVHGIDPARLASVPFLEAAADWVDLALPDAAVADDRATGDVLVIDDFGNVVTNVPGTFLSERDRIAANGDPVPVGETFAAVEPGDSLATVGSHGYVELDVNQERGDEAFGLEAGDRIVLEGIDRPNRR